MKPYAEQLTALSPAELSLAAELSRLRNLEDILRWAPGANIPLAGIDLVQQDEYSYDLFLSLPDSRWLVFGVT